MAVVPGRDNNFDLLRLAFAGAVFLWHLYVLSGAEALAPLAMLFSADIGVKGFFVISGYLVMMSWERSASLADYAGKRARRIYPAYVAVVVACAIGGAALSVHAPADYFGAGLVGYLGANLLFLNFLAPNLPGVFDGQAHTEVNGALWTLKIEVMYYACVPALGWLFGRAGRWWYVAGLYALSVVWTHLTGELHARTGAGHWLQLQRQLPGQLGYFLVGAALYFLRERTPGRWALPVAAALTALALTRLAGAPLVIAVLEPLALGVLVVFVATGLPHFGNFARFGDFSYGVYIIHFPIIQALVAAGAFAHNPWGAAGAATALVLALAALSWHAIERPFLRRQSHYRLAESRAGRET